MKGIVDKLSKKLGTLIGAGGLIALKDDLGLEALGAYELRILAYLVLGYIAVQGAIDIAKVIMGVLAKKWGVADPPTPAKGTPDA